MTHRIDRLKEQNKEMGIQHEEESLGQEQRSS